MQKFFYFLIFCLSPLTIWSQSETERSLSFYNTHTYERLTVIYKKGDAYIQEALGKINTILRDHRTGDIQPIDPKLMDFLYDLLTKVDNLIMACMEIDPHQEDLGHDHPFDQCGIVVQGQIEMFIGDEHKILAENETYFAPAGTKHGWKTFNSTVRLLDISSKT